MGRASLIMVMGFIFVFGLVRSNLNKTGDTLAQGVFEHYEKTVALNIANSLGMIAVRKLTEENDWSEWEDEFKNVSMLSGEGSLNISDSGPGLQPGELGLLAVGKAGRITRRVRIIVDSENLVPEASGALGLVGEDTDDRFVGNSFLVDGTDVNPDGTPGANPPVPGIAVSSPVTKGSLVNELLNEGIQGLVRGSGGFVPNVQLVGDPIPVGDVVNALSGRADLSFEEKPGEYFFFGMPVTWGTPDNPKIVHLKDDVNVFGSLQGAGILIVDDQLDINGDFKWEGMVIVTKDGFLNHSLDLTGGKGEIYGSVIIEAETGSPEMQVAGDLTVQYSSLALERLPGKLNVTYYTVKDWEEW